MIGFTAKNAAYGMIDKAEMVRIWRGSRGDALIMIATFLGTLFLHIEFAVLLGILLSFANYIKNAGMPSVFPVVPDDELRHFVRQHSGQQECPPDPVSGNPIGSDNICYQVRGVGREGCGHHGESQ